MSKIRVLLVDDHALFRAGMRLLLNNQPDMEVAAEAADARAALRQARAVGPDVVTLDLSLPGGSGLETLEQLRQECPRSRVLVLTMHDDLTYLRAALAAGAAGYLMKAAAETQLLAAVRAVHQGRVVIDLHPDSSPPPPDTQEPHLPPRADDPIEQLSEREREVFALLVRGHTNREVAAQLFLSVKTVETYRARIGQKLGLRNRADLVRYALGRGLLFPDASLSEGQPPQQHP